MNERTHEIIKAIKRKGGVKEWLNGKNNQSNDELGLRSRDFRVFPKEWASTLE